MNDHMSPLDVSEAILGWQPGLDRVTAALRRLKEDCDARVDGQGFHKLRDAFDQIGGMAEVALEELGRRHERDEATGQQHDP